jgi:hypothetical protein
MNEVDYILAIKVTSQEAELNTQSCKLAFARDNLHRFLFNPFSLYSPTTTFTTKSAYLNLQDHSVDHIRLDS